VLGYLQVVLSILGPYLPVSQEACMAPNCCGVHIHVGFDCTDASTIGGHWWNSDALEADPWQTIMQLGNDVSMGLK